MKRADPTSPWPGASSPYGAWGNATFIDLLDRDGRIQAMCRRNLLPDSYDTLKELDIGDWLGATGPVFRTRGRGDHCRGPRVGHAGQGAAAPPREVARPGRRRDTLPPTLP